MIDFPRVTTVRLEPYQEDFLVGVIVHWEHEGPAYLGGLPVPADQLNEYGKSVFVSRLLHKVIGGPKWRDFYQSKPTVRLSTPLGETVEAPIQELRNSDFGSFIVKRNGGMAIGWRLIQLELPPPIKEGTNEQ